MTMLIRIIALAATGSLTLQLCRLAFRSRTDLAGEPPIHPALFYLAKICLAVSCLYLVFKALLMPPSLSPAPAVAVLVLLLASSAILTISFSTLGSSLRMGLASEKTELVTRGIYRWSRNPIYVGVYLMMFASLIYAFSWVNAAAAVGGIVLHHRIILSEERHLSQTFSGYQAYRIAVRRYL
jgi:protein-S-isoprenylcysteine O-methyltransferase Ste14